jgi:hypothetical protein
MDQYLLDKETYLIESHSNKRLFSSDELFPTLSLQNPSTDNENPEHLNLIYFCATAQALELDFLPIKWQAHNGLIGVGGTSEIRQSQVSYEVSLAFKSITAKSNSYARNNEDKSVYLLLLAEIQHMGLKNMQDSAYVHKVEGICWDLNQRTGAVSPVLVYRRAQHGDLYHFLDSGGGKSLSFWDRVKLCRKIGIGLEALHASGETDST